MKREKSKNKASLKEPPLQVLPNDSPPEKSKQWDLYALASLLLLGTIIYANSFHNSFHFDDSFNIVDNVNIRDLYDVNAWWVGNRPIAFFTFALNYHFHQLDVWGWHLVNLAIHIINAGLVYWLILLIFSSPGLQKHPILQHKKVFALFTALLFVSHPLATQSVTYIVQRMSSMVTMFYLLSLALYLKARLSPKKNTASYLLFGASFAAAVLALLTKENAYTIPFAIVLVEIFFLQTKKLSFHINRVVLVAVVLLSVITTVLLKFSLSIFNPIGPSLGNTFTVTSMNYLLTQFSVIVKYMQLLLLPIHQNIDYDYPIATSFFEIRTLLSFLFLVSLIGLAVFLFKRNRLISFGIFWFFLTLSIESSIIPITDLIFEHRTYLPSFGFFLVLSASIYYLFWDKYKTLAIAIFLAIIGSNAYLTYERNKVWKDELTLWSDAALKSPDKARPQANVAFAYIKQEKWDKAIPYCLKAIEINPNYFVGYSHLIFIYFKLEQWDKAIPYLSSAIESNPNYFDAIINRAIAYNALGQWDKALADCNRALEINPKAEKAHFNRGIAYKNLGQANKAISDFSSALEINPAYTDAYINRGNTYKDLEQWDKAIADYSSAIGINPTSHLAYFNRGTTYDKLQQWDKAIADYSSAIGIDPKYSPAYFNRGNVFIKLEQWDNAIANYSKVISINPKSPAVYFIRAIAENKMGNNAAACQDMKQAASMGYLPAANVVDKYCQL